MTSSPSASSTTRPHSRMSRAANRWILLFLRSGRPGTDRTTSSSSWQLRPSVRLHPRRLPPPPEAVLRGSAGLHGEQLRLRELKAPTSSRRAPAPSRPPPASTSSGRTRSLSAAASPSGLRTLQTLQPADGPQREHAPVQRPYVDPADPVSAKHRGPQQTNQPNALFGTPTSWAPPRRFVLTALLRLLRRGLLRFLTRPGVHAGPFHLSARSSASAFS